MKRLQTEFRKNTYQYSQVWRDEDFAIYEQSDNGKFVAYEVFRINKNKAGERRFGFAEASESIPNTKKWGKNAWTVGTIAECQFYISFMRLKSKISEKVGVLHMCESV